MINSQTKVKIIFYIEPINSLVNTDILLLSKFEKEFEGMHFNKGSEIQESTNSSNSNTTPMFGKKKGPGTF